MNIKIIGAGMAGLLAGRLLSHRHNVSVIERQNELPNNHSAVLRFRTSAVGDLLNIPFRQVDMVKAVAPWRNPVADALAYSLKNTGVRRSDRSIASSIPVCEKRWVAPADLISQMSNGLDIQFNKTFLFLSKSDEPIVSTMPMSALAKALEYPGLKDIDFKHVAGFNIRAKIPNCDAFVSLMVPDPVYPFSRLSITGDELIIECSGEVGVVLDQPLNAACKLLGIDRSILTSINVHKSPYQKILPIDDQLRKDFIYWATDKFNVFSLGRFATWRPGLLVDDLVQDVRLIEHWIEHRYRMLKHRANSE